MRYYNLYSRTGKIDENGNYSLESSWQLVSDRESCSQQELQNELETWAGNVGDFLREPADSADNNGNFFVYNSALIVRAIQIRITDCRGGVVCYTATPPHSELPSVAEPAVENRDHENILTRTGSWTTRRDNADIFLPAVGDPLNWNGGSFVCTAVKTNDDGESEITFSVTGREISSLQLENPKFSRSADGEETAVVRFFLAASERAAFLATHPAGNAAAWAGDGFFELSSECKPYGIIGFEVALTARKIETRLLGVTRTEEFAGLNLNSGTLQNIVWHARWLVKSADLPSFYHLTGNSTVNWADANALVTRVTPKRLSPQEYEVELVAEDRDNPNLFSTPSDDRSNLAGRTDISVDMAEFYVTAEMAGYRSDGEGGFLAITDWDPGERCPFVASAPLPENRIETTLHTLLITESDYHAGRAGNYLSNMATWAESRVSTNSVGGNSGSFLKIRQTCREVRDNRGNLYTRVNRTYQKAPEHYKWNSNYWDNH